MRDEILDILMITYNRADYTKRTLSTLLDTCEEHMRVWVWHNGSHSETLGVVKALSSHPRFHRLQVSEENKRLREPTNWFWANSTGAYLSKVDDDCLVPHRWATTLMRAHAANPQFGAVGCWRFYDEDFVPELAERKIKEFAGGHRLMRNCWVQGSGYVLKRAVVEQLGPIATDESFTDYCIRGSLAGWQNGWYFPFIHEEHMDDPRSNYCQVRTDEDFMAQRPLSARVDNVTTVKEWASRVRYMARTVQAASPDPLHHTGWRQVATRVKRRLKRLVRGREPWRIA